MSAGLGGAAGMVVNKDDKNAGIFEGFFEDFPWVNDGRRYTTNGNEGLTESTMKAQAAAGELLAKLFKKYGVSAEENILIQYVKDMVA